MTEPDVASSDATNIRCEIGRDGDDYVINGRKWWTSGVRASALQDHDRDGQDRSRRADAPAAVADPGAARHAGREDRCATCRSSATTTRRTATARCCFEDVRVPASNILLGEGRGFEIAQGRLGPGRIHHCMRVDRRRRARARAMCKRVKTRVAFGKPIAEQTVTLERIAESRIDIEQARLLTLKAAYMMDTVGNKVGAQGDRDDQGRGAEHGAQGHRLGDPGARRRRRLATTSSSPAPGPSARTLRLADGPDEVHRNQIGQLELREH